MFRRLAPAAAIAAAVLALPAAASAAPGIGEPTSFSAAFTTKHPGKPTGLKLRTTGAEPVAPTTVAPAIRQTVKLPRGTRLDLGALHQCDVDAQTLGELGAEAACPLDTRIGSGRAEGIANGALVGFDLSVYAIDGRLYFAGSRAGVPLKTGFYGDAKGRRLVLTVPTSGGAIAPTLFEARLLTKRARGRLAAHAAQVPAQRPLDRQGHLPGPDRRRRSAGRRVAHSHRRAALQAQPARLGAAGHAAVAALLPSSSSAATSSGASHIGRCPAPGSTTLRTPGGSLRGRPTSRSCSGHAERDRHADLGELGEAPGAHRRVDVREARRPGVGAHEPQRGVGRHALGIGDRAGERDPPAAPAVHERGQHRQQRLRDQLRERRAWAPAAPATARRARSPSPSARGPRAPARAPPSRRASCPRRARARRARARRGSPRPPRPARAASAGRRRSAPASRRSRAGRARSRRARRRGGRAPAATPAGRRRADAAARAPGRSRGGRMRGRRRRLVSGRACTAHTRHHRPAITARA